MQIGRDKVFIWGRVGRKVYGWANEPRTMLFRRCETRYFAKRIIPVYSSKLLRSYHARGILKSVVKSRLRDHLTFSLVSFSLFFFFFFFCFAVSVYNLSPLRLLYFIRRKSTFSSHLSISKNEASEPRNFGQRWSRLRWLIASPYKVT